MQWSSEPGAGFTDPAVESWLPLGDQRRANVADQRSDPSSVLTLCRDLIALRGRDPRLVDGAYAEHSSPPGTWAWGRGDGLAVAVNLSGSARRVEGLGGSIALSTRRDRDGDRVTRPLELRPWEGVVVSDR